MNHLGDTNKMVSDTPRMDASAHDDGAIWETGCDIERELNAANVEIDEKRKDIVYLATEKAKLEERIKRLEEAGDELIDYLKHRIKTDPLNPIWHTASIKWGKVKKEDKL